MKKYFLWCLVTALVLSSIPFAPVPVYAANTISTGGNVIVDQNIMTLLEGVSIEGDPGTFPVKLLVTNGTLEMTTTTGLTFTGPETGSELYFSGAIADINAALATLTYTRATLGEDTLEISLVEPGEVFFEENGHLYEYIVFTGTWQQAQAHAETQERYGVFGYLATITSAEENEFVRVRLGGAGWMGASDAAVEGDWKWVTGPEAGTSFWSGTGGGSTVDDMYANWNTGEPNDSSGNEDCGQFLAGGTGRWNDLPCTGMTLDGYVVEFGAPDALPATVGASFTITTVDMPALLTLSPEDGAEDVSRNADLVLTFDEAVEVGMGNITIYEEGGAIAEVIDVIAGRVTGSGTDTITVDPFNLRSGRSYYVQIDATAFDNLAGGSYAGILNNTTWNFSVARSGGRTDRLNRVLDVPEESSPDDSASTEDAVTDTEAGTEEDQVTDTEEREESEEIVPIEEFQEMGPQVPVRTHDFADGILVKRVDHDTVYLVEGGKRRPFIHHRIFHTWHADFDAVRFVTTDELASIPLGSPVLPRAGSLVKLRSIPHVYVVEGDLAPTLRHLPNENAAEAEFGASWAKMIFELDITLFQNFRR